MNKPSQPEYVGGAVDVDQIARSPILRGQAGRGGHIIAGMRLGIFQSGPNQGVFGLTGLLGSGKPVERSYYSWTCQVNITCIVSCIYVFF